MCVCELGEGGGALREVRDQRWRVKNVPDPSTQK